MYGVKNNLNLKTGDNSVIISLTVIPNSNKNKLYVDPDSGEIICEVKAKPIKGNANKNVIKMLSKRFNIASANIDIVKGLKTRDKIIVIKNRSKDEIIKILLGES